ncbi:MAG: porin family protein [Notoacmeibacter sp.]|nr:porin family protein [Notoacmeibacter sp.]
MNAFLLRLALVSTVMVPVTSALAADLEPPPPIEELRPATYDWSGAHIGIFGAANAVDGYYDATLICGGPCPIVDPEMSGIGYGFGIKAGLDYQVDNFVIGVVGDWAFGGRLADNDDPIEATYLNMPNLATLRARAGIADGNTLIYLTGGMAAAEMEFGALVGPGSVDSKESQWAYGWAIGGGIEHAFTDSLSVGLEYLYIDLPDTEHFLTDGAGVAGTIDMHYKDMHTVRASLNYRFSL